MLTLTCTPSPDPTWYCLRIWDWHDQWVQVHLEVEHSTQSDAAFRLQMAINIWSSAEGARWFELWKYYNGSWVRCFWEGRKKGAT